MALEVFAILYYSVINKSFVIDLPNTSTVCASSKVSPRTEIWQVKSPASEGVMSLSSSLKSPSWSLNLLSLVINMGPADKTSCPFLQTTWWSPETDTDWWLLRSKYLDFKVLPKLSTWQGKRTDSDSGTLKVFGFDRNLGCEVTKPL